jgi:hypothetical protein
MTPAVKSMFPLFALILVPRLIPTISVALGRMLDGVTVVRGRRARQASRPVCSGATCSCPV